MEFIPGNTFPTVKLISVLEALIISQLTSPIVTTFFSKASSSKPSPVNAKLLD